MGVKISVQPGRLQLFYYQRRLQPGIVEIGMDGLKNEIVGRPALQRTCPYDSP
jgi:hypothetical protein